MDQMRNFVLTCPFVLTHVLTQIITKRKEDDNFSVLYVLLERLVRTLQRKEEEEESMGEVFFNEGVKGNKWLQEQGSIRAKKASILT